MLNSKYFVTTLGVDQFHTLLAGFEDKSAQAICTFAYSEGPGSEPIFSKDEQRYVLFGYGCQTMSMKFK